jgi:hypothetical protein
MSSSLCLGNVIAGVDNFVFAPHPIHLAVACGQKRSLRSTKLKSKYGDERPVEGRIK